ncbi:MAG: hypothetical protein RLZZ393_1472 [Pseudomonadota bacterium]|jgi:dienelactone hydrolase
MRHRQLFRALALSCLVAGSTAAVAAGPDDPVAAATQRAARGGEGPYRALMTMDARLPTHTLYRPADLTAGPGRWPVIVWGNGACHNLGNRFRYFLTEIASHGYVIIAIGPIGAQLVESKVELTPEEAGRPAGAKSTTNWRQLIEAMDFAEAENAREGSAFHGRLDTKHIAVMGQSCGGLQAITASADPRVTTSVIWNSGTFDNTSAALDGTDATRDSLKKLHAPIAYISGDSSDVAFKNSNADYALLAPTLPAFRGWAKGIGHTGTYRQPGGGLFTGVALDWLDWQLKGDKQAAKRFTGKDCGLCKDGGWVVESRNLR